jgi:hypothetical protein
MTDAVDHLEAARNRLTNALQAEEPASLIQQALALVTHAIIELRQQQLDRLRRELASGPAPLKMTKRGVPRKPRADAGKPRGSYKLKKRPRRADK